MTAQELKDYILTQLAVPVNQVIKVINSLFAIVDFTTTQVSTIIPDWTNALTFNTDGSGDGKYCKHPDTNGKKRIFETKTDGNINNAPPTNPIITENTHWTEVSSSSSAAIPEWSAGLYGPGLIIVYHNHSVDGRGLYVLLDPVRPFNSTNIETEITAGDWEPIASGGGSGGGVVIPGTYADIAALLADQANQEEGSWYMVDDASADATVDTGWAIYEKLAATTGAIGDYIKRAEQESLDVTFGAWTETTGGAVERSTAGGASESENIATQAAAGTAAGLSASRTPSEVGLKDMLIKLFNTAITWVAQPTFTVGPIVSDATASLMAAYNGSKKLVSIAYATAADLITGTDATKPLTSDAFNKFRSIRRSTATFSSNVITCDADSRREMRFEYTSTLTAGFTISLLNWTNLEWFELIVFCTGSLNCICPDGTSGKANTVMEEETPTTIWNNSTKTTVLAGGTASPFVLSFKRVSSTMFELRRTYKLYTS